jgi:hypothetical protein
MRYYRLESTLHFARDWDVSEIYVAKEFQIYQPPSISNHHGERRGAHPFGTTATDHYDTAKVVPATFFSLFNYRS